MKRSLSILLAASCTICALPITAQDSAAAPHFSLEQKMLLRCSTAFALTAQAQSEGDAQALQHPPLANKGNEFFVRSMARVMDEAKLSRDQVIAQVVLEREELQQDDMLEQVMPACLQLLKN